MSIINFLLFEPFPQFLCDLSHRAWELFTPAIFSLDLSVLAAAAGEEFFETFKN